MMKVSFLLLLLPLFFVSCRPKPTAGESLPFNPCVEAFTSGKISRQAPVYVLFNRDVDSLRAAGTNWKRAARITPQIDGEFVFENPRTLIFKPAEGFARNTEYAVALRLDKWFGEMDEADRTFVFRFSTRPLMLRGNIRALDPAAGADSLYDVSAVVYTSDTENEETVESLVAFSEPVEAAWTHAPDGTRHEVTLKNLAAKNVPRSLTASVGPNKFGVEREKLFTFEVPGSREFNVFETHFTTDPQRFIEVTFSKNLDPEQELRGLAWIEGNADDRVTVEGNKLRLYPDAGKRGRVTVRLSGTIRSAGGIALGEERSVEVETASDVPSIEFLGGGTIIPQSTRLTVPFQTVYLRGVVVRVIKVPEGNVGQFLQVNGLGQARELARVGRLVARRTIFFDGVDEDPSRINTFALDLRELIDPEPGAIYRIELSADKELSAYPGTAEDQPTREEILARDELRFREESTIYDSTGEYNYYYYDDDSDWDYQTYYTTEYTPDSDYFWYGVKTARNVLATNLALTALGGQTGELTVLVHNLLTTLPERGVEVAVRNYQHMEMGRGTTDEQGRITIGYDAGKPFYVVASKERQRAYLRVDDGSALSLSTFDVGGEVVQRGIKGFIYGERGVWRPGETIHLSFLLNDRAHTLPENHPVTVELVDPLGQVYLKKNGTNGTMGLWSFDLSTDPDAPTGAWTARVEVGGAVFTRGVRIETIKPNRLKIVIPEEDKTLLSGEPMEVPIHLEWMTGAVARGLAYDIQATFQPAGTTFGNYKEYLFDDPAKRFAGEESAAIRGVTDEGGDGTITASFDPGRSAPGMLTGNFVVRAYEESGDFSLDAFQMRFSPYERYVGIRPPQKTPGREWLDTGSPQRYEVAAVDHTGKPEANVELEATVYEVQWYWWWSADRNRLANFIADSHNEPVKTMRLTTGADGRARFDLEFTRNEWGTYYVAVKDLDGGHSTGTMDYYDWPDLGARRDAEGSEGANILTFKTDKESYAPGERMTVTIPSAAGARAVVSVLNGSRVLAIHEFECREGETTAAIPVTEEMQPNAYIHISLLQPHGNTENDLPIRLYGVVPVAVTSSGSRLEPVIGAAEEMKPEERYSITVSERHGREMAYTLAIVDDGLLDLTRFKTPDPWAVFNAREALGVSTWDVYNDVVGAYGGRVEQFFSIGGDGDAAAGPKAIVNRFKPVVQFEGPFKLKPGERRKHWYTMPNYNGRVRVMVVAGDGVAYGNAERSVFVRKPVMILGTLPRVIGTGEEMDVPAAVFATKENVGRVQVSIRTSDNMEVVGERQKTLDFRRIEDRTTTFRVRVKDTPGAGKVTLSATGGGETAASETDIEIRAVRRPQTKLTALVLAPGQSIDQTVALPGAAGTNTLTLEVSDIPPLNLTARLDYLLGYPHGCLEQITSKAFPQLYLRDFAALTREQEASVGTAVTSVIDRYRNYRMADGTFAYWPGGSYANGWASNWAAHFLIEAEGKGYHVPAALKNDALNSLRRAARGWNVPSDKRYTATESYTQAYRLYVLALGKAPEIGAMNRLKERQELDANSRWMLAAAYALTGRADVAGQLIERTTPVGDSGYDPYDLTYGSGLRERAVRLMTLCLLGRANEAAELARGVSEDLARERWYSTQTTAFALMAVSKYLGRYAAAGEMAFTWKVNGKSEKVSTPKHLWTAAPIEKGAPSAAVAFTNTGNSTLFLRLLATGTPEQGLEEAYAHGVALDVAYTDASGRPVDPARMVQGTNFKATVTVRNASGDALRNLALTQVFPAGWEILNTRFLNDGATDENVPGISHQDIRDDRVYSYIDYLPAGRHVAFSIDLSAVYRGRFYLPPVWCEAMYDGTVRTNTVGATCEIE